MRPLFAGLATLAVLMSTTALAQPRSNVSFYNMMPQPVAIRLDDGQSCNLPSVDEEGACRLSLTPGRHELKVETSTEILTADIDVPADGGEVFLYEDQIAGP